MEISEEIKKIAESNPTPAMLKTLSHLVPLNRELNFVDIVLDSEYVDAVMSYGQYEDRSYTASVEYIEANYPNIEYPDQYNLAEMGLSRIKQNCKDNELLLFFFKCNFVYELHKKAKFIHTSSTDKKKIDLNTKYFNQVVKPYFIKLKEKLEEEALKYSNKDKHKILRSFAEDPIKKVRIFKWIKGPVMSKEGRNKTSEEIKKELYTLLITTKIRGKTAIKENTKYVDFEKLFSDSGETITKLNKIDWQPAKTLLAYFIDELVYTKFVDNAEFWQRSYNVFLVNGKPILDLSSPKAQYLNNENSKPNNYELIDSIFLKLNNS